MKLPRHQPGQLRPSHHAAFMLVDTLVSLGIYVGIIVSMMVGVQVFGLRVHTLAATKLTATSDCRRTLNTLREQIRSAKSVFVGNYSQGTFSRITNGLPQTGNALAIYFTDTNNLQGEVPVIYYQDPSGATKAIFRNKSNSVTLFANYVTTYYVFTAEDYQANTMTSYNNNPVIRITLQFYQWEYPISIIGSNGINAYNSYRLQTRISRRSKD